MFSNPTAAPPLYQVAHKEGMLSFVEREVHSVKTLFAEKEQSLQAELRLRTAEIEGQLRAAQQAAHEAEEAATRQRSRADEAERSKAQVEADLVSSSNAKERLAEQLAARGVELSAAREEKEKIEGEMRLVLRAMDQQKKVATRNMADLQRIYTDWDRTVNS